MNLANISFDITADGNCNHPIYYDINSSEINEDAANLDLQRMGAQYDLECLMKMYIYGIKGVKNFYESIKENSLNKSLKNNLPRCSYDELLGVPFAYVLPAARDEMPVSDAAACYDARRGIFILTTSSSQSGIAGSIIHEYGHYLHHTLHPAVYYLSDETIKEVMAILIEEKIDPCYVYRSESPHGQAKTLLRKLEQFDFYNEMDLAQKWLYLSIFTDSSELEDALSWVEKRQQNQKNLDSNVPC